MGFCPSRIEIKVVKPVSLSSTLPPATCRIFFQLWGPGRMQEVLGDFEYFFSTFFTKIYKVFRMACNAKKRLPLAWAGNRWLGPVPKYLNTLGLGTPFSSPVRWHHGPVSMRTFLKQLFGTQLGNQTPFWQFGLILILIILIVEIKEKILKNIDCWKLLKYLDFVDLDISNYFVIKCRKMASKKSSHSGLIVLPPF